jgi:transposase
MWDEDRSGRPSLWTDETEAVLKALLAQSPDQLGYYAVNWTVPLLQEQLEDDAGVWFSDETVRRELRHLGYVWKRGRYQLAPDPELEKKTPDTPENRQFAAPERAVG